MRVDRVVRDVLTTVRKIVDALDNKLTFRDNFEGGQGSAIADADGTLGSATAKVNAILAEMRRNGTIDT